MIKFLYAFLVGGAICAVGQILMDKTKLTPARILVLYVTTGVVLGSLGIYQKIVNFAGAGATIPLIGFGHTLAKGAFKDVDQYGPLGALTGGIRAGAAGVSAAILFGYFVSIASKPKAKS